MNKISCIIIEDDLISLKSLEKMISTFDKLKVCATFENGTDALEYLKVNTIDLLFLDIELPDMKGWELLDNLSIIPLVIVTTGKKEYAFDAFQYSVSSFLEKPIGLNEIKKAIDNVSKQLEQRKELQSSNEIYIKNNGKLIRINYSNLIFIENIADYVKIFTTTNVYIIYCTLKHLEYRLPSSIFMKIHRSYIINLSKINYIEDNMVYINDKIIPIARAQKSDLLEKLNLL